MDEIPEVPVSEKGSPLAGAPAQDKKGLGPARVVCVVAAALLVAVFFLPYISMTAENRGEVSDLGELANTVLYEGSDLRAVDAVDLSLFEFARIYAALSEISETYLVVAAVFVLPGVFSLLALLLAAFKKPIGTMVFAVLTAAVTFPINSLLEEAGAISSGLYGWGIAKWLYLVAGIVLVAAAAWLFVAKRQKKRVQA